MHDLFCLFVLLAVQGFIQFKQLGKSHDCIEWSPELVGNTGEKSAFGIAGPFGSFLRCLQGILQIQSIHP